MPDFKGLLYCKTVQGDFRYKNDVSLGNVFSVQSFNILLIQ